MKATVAGILGAHGRIDGLVNNAGGQFQAPLEDISQKGWETVVRTNLTGGFLMARECYTQWMREHGGVDRQHRRRHVARHAGHGPLGRRARGHGQLHADGGGRMGVVGRARQRGGAGLDRLLGHRPLSAGVSRRIRVHEGAHVPLQRFGTESEVSAAIVFLLSQAASFISGATLRVDGAVPNNKVGYRLPPNNNPAPAYNGFHRAVMPKVLREE